MGAYDSLWDSVKPMTGDYTINYFQYQEDVRYVCMLNDWTSGNDEICADNYNYFRFKLKGKGHSEMWEVYLYGDKTIKVDRDSAEVLSVTQLGDGSHHLQVVLVFRAWHGNENESGRSSLEREVQRDVRVRGSSCETYRNVFRSPFDRKHHRCHRSRRDHVWPWGAPWQHQGDMAESI